MNYQMRDIEYFAAVAQHGHIGRAAEALGLSQPALSKSLRRLEHSMRAKVVKRTPKGVELTLVGSALLSHVDRLRLAQEDIAREVADLSEGRSGHLRIGVTSGIAEELAGAVAARLMNEAPKVTLGITVTVSEQLTKSLRDGELDLYIAGILATSTAGIVNEHLFDDPFVVYASVNHRLANHKKLTLADLVRERWTASAAWTVRQRLNRVFEEKNLAAPQFALESNSTAARLRAVASSQILGFSSRGFVAQAMQRFRLVELPVRELSVVRHMGVSYRKDAYLSPAAKRFIVILKATAKEIAKD